MWRLIVFPALAALSAVVSSGCRDLSYREPGAQNEGPKVEFVTPAQDALLPLRPRVELRAEDADGVAAVTLSCGPMGGPLTPLVTWTAEPYAADVLLANCISGAMADAEGNAQVELMARATDPVGAFRDTQVTVRVNPRLPALAVDVLQRIRPGASIHIAIQADRALAAPPSVLVEGAPVAVTAGAAPNQYTATFVAPPIGGGLEDVERPLRLDITAVGTEGNRVDVQRQVLVSRLAWERSVPARLALPQEEAPNAVPSPTAGGVWLAIQLEDGNGWRPAFVSAEAGAFTVPPTDGFAGVALSTAGPVVERAGANAPATRRLGINGEVLAEAAGVLGRGPAVEFPDRLCAVADTRTVGDMCIGGSTFLRCFGPGGTFTNTTPATFAGGQGGIPAVIAASGSLAAAVHLQPPPFACTSDDVATILWSTPTATTAANQTPTALQHRRLLPVGDTGTFIVVFDDRFGALEAGRIQNGAYTPLYTPLPTPNVLAALPDERLLTADPGADTTALALRTPQGQTGSAVLPLRVEYAPGPNPLLPQNVVRFDDGRIAFLGRANDFSRVVVALAADLTPQWVYRYPRASGSAMLVRGASGPMYFVDLENSHLVAFHEAW